MNRTAVWRSAFLLLILSLGFLPLVGAVSLQEFLNRKEVREVKSLKGEAPFEEILEILVEQPLDHRNPDGPTFTQRIYISHAEASLPVVLITAGYDAKYYYTSEITTELKCNQVMVEHRFFGRSKPDSLAWNYLDTWQAASDHHRIVTLFKDLYTGPWISTGISKGGQSVIYHSYYYPEDVDLRVPYVAPLNLEVEDQRIYDFLGRVGTPKERRKVRRFQKLALKHQEEYLPHFEEFSREKEYTYQMVGGLEKAYEYCVLEYSFAFWQWGYSPVSKIPGRSDPPGEWISHMNHVAGFDYFADQFITEYQPFFYQALTEMGYYGYDLEAFDRYLQHLEIPTFVFTLPEGVETPFNPRLSRDIKEYLASEGNNFVYIYGEYDTWSATAVTSTGQTNSRIFIKAKGSHRTRINNMPPEQRREVYRTIREFLEI